MSNNAIADKFFDAVREATPTVELYGLTELPKLIEAGATLQRVHDTLTLSLGDKVALDDTSLKNIAKAFIDYDVQPESEKPHLAEFFTRAIIGNAQGIIPEEAKRTTEELKAIAGGVAHLFQEQDHSWARFVEESSDKGTALSHAS